MRTLRRVAAAALVFGVAVGTTACDMDTLLDVNDRDTVNPSTLEDPGVIDVVINGAVGNFQNAFDGGDSYVAVSALFTDEFYSSGTFTTRTATDRRNQFEPANGNTSDGAYNGLQYARRALKDAAALVAEHPDMGPDTEDYAHLKALEGYTLIGLGEGFCSAVPLSALEEGEFVYGEPLTSSQIFDEAIDRFDTSLGASANHLAAVGKARALLDQGQYAAAATAVAGVPMDYVFFIQHSESGGDNAIFGLQGNGRYSVSAGEGTTGNTIDFIGQGAEYDSGANLLNNGDDRSPWYGPVPGFDGGIDQYITLLYNGVGDNTPLASGVEAWLIRAEAELHGGTPAAATGLLNELRQNADALLQGLHEWPVSAGNELADLPPATTFAEGMEQVFTERAFWLFLTGHRLGDLRRQIYLPEYPAATDDDVYPAGDYHKGGSYGDDVVFPIDFDENNNPNFDVSMCDVGSASIN